MVLTLVSFLFSAYQNTAKKRTTPYTPVPIREGGSCFAFDGTLIEDHYLTCTYGEQEAHGLKLLKLIVVPQ